MPVLMEVETSAGDADRDQARGAIMTTNPGDDRS